VEVERRPDADQDRRRQTVSVARHPQLLFRSAEPYPNDVGSALVDCFDYRFILVGASRLKGRGMGTDDLSGRELRCEIALKEGKRSRGRSIQEVPVAGLLKMIEDCR
jgi:hypothetical protein